jgi:hypothetical protein
MCVWLLLRIRGEHWQIQTSSAADKSYVKMCIYTLLALEINIKLKLKLWS